MAGAARMRVLIDTTYARRAPYSGTGIYIERLCQQLERREDLELVQVANGRRRPPAGGGLGSVRNLATDIWWAGLELPRLARLHAAEVVHHPLPAIAATRSARQVITVHDLAFELLPREFDSAFRIYAHQTYRAAALAASAVICPSDTTAADLRECWGVPAKRIVVAPHGPGQELPVAVERAPTDPRHFLYVGDDEPRKNLSALLRAYGLYREEAERPLELVLAGSASAGGAGVRLERHPSPQRLAVLYEGAAALVHPSLYEGFGLTILEAMRAGTPVLAGRSPGTVEVGADAVRYADPRDSRSFATSMAQLAESRALRAKLAEVGRRRAAQFSWEKSARAHLGAYSLGQRRR